MFTSETIQNEPEIREKLYNVFEKIYSGSDMGYLKTDPAAYTAIAKDLGVAPKDITFIDDLPQNIAAAKAAGLNAIWYQGLADLKGRI